MTTWTASPVILLLLLQRRSKHSSARRRAVTASRLTAGVQQCRLPDVRRRASAGEQTMSVAEVPGSVVAAGARRRAIGQLVGDATRRSRRVVRRATLVLMSAAGWRDRAETSRLVIGQTATSDRREAPEAESVAGMPADAR